MTASKLAPRLASFRSIWKGGFWNGDPLDRLHSPYGLFGYVGVPYAITLRCIRPYISAGTVALEIGPGRGAYTRAMLEARELWCLHALSAEHNAFWEYVGDQPHVHYEQVDDFSCAMLPDDAIDFVFSYDVLCHVPFDGIEAYATALLPELRSGAHCFWMVADSAKYRRFIAERPSVAPARGPEGSWWYDASTERTVDMLEPVGYSVFEPDVEIDPRSPIVHFLRP